MLELLIVTSKDYLQYTYGTSLSLHIIEAVNHTYEADNKRVYVELLDNYSLFDGKVADNSYIDWLRIFKEVKLEHPAKHMLIVGSSSIVRKNIVKLTSPIIKRDKKTGKLIKIIEEVESDLPYSLPGEIIPEDNIVTIDLIMENYDKLQPLTRLPDIDFNRDEEEAKSIEEYAENFIEIINRSAGKNLKLQKESCEKASFDKGTYIYKADNEEMNFIENVKDKKGSLPLVNTFFSCGAIAVLASSTVVFEKKCDLEEKNKTLADYLQEAFFNYLMKGYTVGEAIVKARIEAITKVEECTENYLSADSQCDLLSLDLYGNPMLRIGEKVKESKKEDNRADEEVDYPIEAQDVEIPLKLEWQINEELKNFGILKYDNVVCNRVMCFSELGKVKEGEEAELMQYDFVVGDVVYSFFVEDGDIVERNVIRVN